MSSIALTPLLNILARRDFANTALVEKADF